MPRPLTLGALRLHWLDAGRFELDAGTMFGVVPKVLWSQRYPCTADNHLLLANRALLVRADKRLVLIDTGIGNKLSAKQRRNFRVREEWSLPARLADLGIDRREVTDVVLTHGDFDHAGGVTMRNASGEVELTFPLATHYLQTREWEDILRPGPRTGQSYWPENFVGLRPGENLRLVDGTAEILPGITLAHTGGHTRGHQAVWLRDRGGVALHLGDLLPNHAHGNPLWVTPFDNFPLDSVEQKERLLRRAAEEGAWLTLYHDPYLDACTFDSGHNVVRRYRYGGESA